VPVSNQGQASRVETGADLKRGASDLTAQAKCFDKGEVLALSHLHGPVTTIGDEQSISARNEGDPLRLIEARQTGLEPTTLQIDNAKGVVSELGNEQPFAGRIESHMVNAAFDGAKGNFSSCEFGGKATSAIASASL
jgi:hypothetical protein